jgi:altronate hydrolase
MCLVSIFDMRSSKRAARSTFQRMANRQTYVQIHPKDNVIVALQDLPKGTAIAHHGGHFNLYTDIAAKHKFTTTPLNTGDEVVMYGVLVGKATRPIEQGEWISTDNLTHKAEAYTVARRSVYAWQAPDVEMWRHRTFMGYHRSDGSVGTRNFWLVIPLVFCENRNILLLKDAFERELGFAQPEKYRWQVRQMLDLVKGGQEASIDDLVFEDTGLHTPARNPYFPNVDGIKFLTHEMGCGGTNEDCQVLAEVFAGFCINPNVAGITVLSLGCQKTQIEDVMAEINRRSPHFDKPILYYNQQTYGTEHALMTTAVRDTFKGLIEINKIKRQPAPLSKINLGLKCGGSDGFSGISANPALGHASDILVTLGGKTLLAEFPELCGVEQDLINRCEAESDAEKFVHLMDTYAAQAKAVGSSFDMNPSKGNIKDGLITDAIKSAGAAKKGGNAPVSGVLRYTEQPVKSGLHLLCTPGNDVLATTGMAASGANLIVFTTGLGTPTGNAVTPTAKVSTNTRLAEKMTDIIDFNSGKIISGEETISENGEAMLEYLIGLASGEYLTKAEILGQDDFIPWRTGINL